MSNLKLDRHAKYARTLKKFSAAAFLATTLVGGYGLYRQSVSASAPVNQQIGFSSVAAVAPTTTPDGQYTDGEYTGDAYRAGRWGNVQAKAVIENGQITDIQILDYPRHRSTSNQISHIALPTLMEEAIQTQNANVDMISGATLTSEAFIASLQSALDSASAGVPASNASV